MAQGPGGSFGVLKSTCCGMEMNQADSLTPKRFVSYPTGHPLLLKGNNTSAAGIAWLHVDEHCRLHFDVSVSGMSRHQSGNNRNVGDERHILELIEMPGQPRVTRSQRIALQKFDGIYINSIESDLNQITLSRLDSGVSYLKLTSKHYPLNVDSKQKPEPIRILELKTRIHSVRHTFIFSILFS